MLLVPSVMVSAEPNFDIIWLDGEFTSALAFSEGLARVTDGTRNFHNFIDRNGTVVIPSIHHISLRSFSENLAAVGSITGTESRWGFIDRTGAEVIPFIYYEVRDFSEGLAAVRIGAGAEARWGFIDTDGEIVIPIIYNSANSFSNGLAVVSTNAGRGFIDKSGNWAENELGLTRHRVLDSFSEGLAWVVTENLRPGFINAMGQVEFFVGNGITRSRGFTEGMAAVGAGSNSYGFLNKAGELIVPLIYDEVRSFSEGLAAVRQGNRWGFIDKTGAVVVPIIYYEAWSFSDGLARVRLGDWWDESGIRWGFIDQTGGVVVPITYNDVTDFSDGAAIIRLGNRWGILRNPLLAPPRTAEVIAFNGANVTISSDIDISNAAIMITGQIGGKVATIARTESDLSPGENTIPLPFSQTEDIRIIVWECMSSMIPLSEVFEQ